MWIEFLLVVEKELETTRAPESTGRRSHDGQMSILALLSFGKYRHFNDVNEAAVCDSRAVAMVKRESSAAHESHHSRRQRRFFIRLGIHPRFILIR